VYESPHIFKRGEWLLAALKKWFYGRLKGHAFT